MIHILKQRTGKSSSFFITGRPEVATQMQNMGFEHIVDVNADMTEGSYTPVQLRQTLSSIKTKSMLGVSKGIVENS